MVFGFGPQTLQRRKTINQPDPLTQYQGDAFGQYDPRKASGYDPRMGMFSPPGQTPQASPPPAAGPADSEGGFDWQRALAVLGATLQDTGAALDGRQGGALGDFSAEEQAAAEANKRTKAQRELMGALQSGDPQTIRTAAMQYMQYGDPSPFLKVNDIGKPQPEEAYTLSQGQRRYRGDQVIAEAPAEPELTTDERNARALRLLPGTPEYDAYLRDATLPRAAQTTINNIPPNQTFNNETTLRNNYQDQSKSFGPVQDAYGRITSVPESAAGDLSLIYSYVKMLDPGSVVRESEFATAETARPLLERYGISYDAVKSFYEGKRLTPGARQDFVSSATSLYDAAVEQQAARDEEYRNIATRNNLNPDNIILGVRNLPAKARGGGAPVKITSDAEYNQLPSGAQFVGPDGVLRKKP